MTVQIRQLHPLFAGEATGVDLRYLTDRAAIDEIAAALDRHAVLVFREQMIDDEHQIAFSSLFGKLETPIGKIRKDRKQRLRKELADISNLDENNNIRAASDRWRMMLLANELWHTDSSFKRVPAKFSLLSAREIPPDGGETEFADLRAAYEALDEIARERIAPLFAEHSIFHSRSLVGYTEFSDDERAALPPVRQPVVRFHSGSERRTLYLGSHASHIIGWPADQGRALLEELTVFATQPRFVYQHRWRVGDLVMWDNRCTLHRARPFDDARYRRDMRRTTVEDSAPALPQSRSCLAAGN
jgi:alpha-ketoglutarate-dependent 2,4-dichlorophenoxyacetate dioxygenase